MSWTRGRRGGLLVAGIGGILLAVLAVGSVALLDTAASPAASTREQMCAEYEALVDELNRGAVFSTQASIRSARKLSQLAGRYPDQVAAISGEPAVGQADSDIRRVLRSVAWETPDLLAATRPIALECGWVWPVSSIPPDSADSARSLPQQPTS